MTRTAPVRLGAFAVAALCACVVGYASTGAVPKPFPVPDRKPAEAAPRPAPSTASGPQDRDLVSVALQLRGTPYRSGGNTLGGFDCSGFTQYVFARNGIRLPRAVEEQYEQGKKLKPRDLESGDLVFFKTVSRGPSHVGIVVGDDQFIHAPSSKGVVRIERLSSEYWSKRFIAARRVD